MSRLLTVCVSQTHQLAGNASTANSYTESVQRVRVIKYTLKLFEFLLERLVMKMMNAILLREICWLNFM